MKKILVTGAVGQVGRFLIRKLLEEKINFAGLDIRSDGELPKFELLNIRITNKQDLETNKSYLEDIDVLVHLASKIDVDSDIIKSGPTSIELNAIGTLNLLEYLPNLKHICYTSTYMVYGVPKTNPVTEDHITDPNTVYGATKLATEKFLQVFAQQRGIDLTILRIMGIYGLEKPYTQAIPNFIKMIATDKNPIIYGSGNIRRNHIYINDVIDAILVSVRNPKDGTFNIGGSDMPTNLDLLEIINKKLGKTIRPIFKETKDAQYDFIADISKAKNVLGFTPKIGIEDGMVRTINLFQKFGW